MTVGAIMDRVDENLARKAALETAAQKAFHECQELETKAFLARTRLTRALAELAAWQP